MKPLVILVHGFNVWDGGRASVGRLRPFFAEYGVPYLMINYGHFGLLDSRFKNDKIAKIIADAITNADRPVLLVGHSNGCCIIYRAATRYASIIDRAVFINPALRSDINLSNTSIKSTDIWHSPSDKPVRWAEKLPFADARPWGDMGADGADFTNDSITNFNKERNFAVSSSEHSDVFTSEKLAYFGPLIAAASLRDML